MTEFHTRKIGNASLSHQALAVAYDFANEDDLVLDTESIIEAMKERIDNKYLLSDEEKEIGDLCKRAFDAGVEVLVVCH